MNPSKNTCSGRVYSDFGWEMSSLKLKTCFKQRFWVGGITIKYWIPMFNWEANSYLLFSFFWGQSKLLNLGCLLFLATDIFIFPQLSSFQLLSRVRLFVTPWTAARQASLSIINSKSLLKLMYIESVMPSNHLILCRPLSPPSFNLSQHQGLFQWVSSSRQVAKVLELQLQHQSFQWIFRTDFL